MIGLTLAGGILIAALLQGILRGGRAAVKEAPPSLRRVMHGVLLLGTITSIAPLLPLAIDLLRVRSAAELTVLVVFIVISLALILPAWIWLFLVSRGTTTRSATAFVVASATVNGAIAAALYRGFLAGEADSQDGIVVHLAPLMQLVVTAVASLLRRALDNGRDMLAINAEASGRGRAGND